MYSSCVCDGVICTTSWMWKSKDIFGGSFLSFYLVVETKSLLLLSHCVLSASWPNDSLVIVSSPSSFLLEECWCYRCASLCLAFSHGFQNQTQIIRLAWKVLFLNEPSWWHILYHFKWKKKAREIIEAYFTASPVIVWKTFWNISLFNFKKQHTLILMLLVCACVCTYE